MKPSRPKIVVKHPTYQPSTQELRELDEAEPLNVNPEDVAKCLRGDLVYENPKSKAART